MLRNQKGRRPIGLRGMLSPHSSLRTGVRRLGTALAFLLLSPALSNAQEAWDGNAAAIRRGTFPEAGLFAASNSFPKNSRVEVRNLATGKTVQVTVLQRIEETDNIFILLSEQAAQRLGLSGSEVVRVTARLVSGSPAPALEPGEEQAFNPDPDINPAAELQARAPERPLEPAALEEPAAVEEPAPTLSEAQEEPQEAIQEAGPEATAEQPPRPAAEETVAEEEPVLDVPAAEKPAAQKPAEEPSAPQPSAEEQRLAELQQRLPQKQLYQPPRQSERFALSLPEEPAAEVPAEEEPQEEEPVLEEPAVEEPPVIVEAEPAEEPQLLETEPRVSLLGPEATEEELIVQLPVPRPLEPDRPEAEGSRLPAPEEEQPLALEPAAPPVQLPEGAPAEVAEVGEAPEAGPPVSEPEEVVAAVTPTEVPEEQAPEGEPEAVARATPLSADLPRQAYFLQLGAYSSRSLAEKLAGNLGPNYQVSILPTADRNRTVYKVLIGPLNTDESGTLLYLFKARGFKDAFLRYVE